MRRQWAEIAAHGSDQGAALRFAAERGGDGADIGFDVGNGLRLRQFDGADAEAAGGRGRGGVAAAGEHEIGGEADDVGDAPPILRQAGGATGERGFTGVGAEPADTDELAGGGQCKSEFVAAQVEAGDAIWGREGGGRSRERQRSRNRDAATGSAHPRPLPQAGGGKKAGAPPQSFSRTPAWAVRPGPR
jgi:hypothetical protein